MSTAHERRWSGLTEVPRTRQAVDGPATHLLLAAVATMIFVPDLPAMRSVDMVADIRR